MNNSERRCGLLLLLSLIAASGCGDSLGPEDESQIQPDSWSGVVDPAYDGLRSITVEVEPGRIVIVGWLEKKNTCLHTFPLAYLGPEWLRVELQSAPKGTDCRAVDQWIRFEGRFRAPGSKTYRVVVEDRGLIVVDRDVWVPPS